MQKLVKLLPHHRAARSGGGNDIGIRLEYFDHALGEFAGFGMESVVEKWLAATGLGGGESHFATEAFEDFGHGDANVRIKLIGQACNK